MQSWHEHSTLHDNDPSVENVYLEHEIMQAENKLLTMLEHELLGKASKYEQECEMVDIKMAKNSCLFDAFARHVDAKKLTFLDFLLSLMISNYHHGVDY